MHFHSIFVPFIWIGKSFANWMFGGHKPAPSPIDTAGTFSLITSPTSLWPVAARPAIKIHIFAESDRILSSAEQRLLQHLRGLRSSKSLTDECIAELPPKYVLIFISFAMLRAILYNFLQHLLQLAVAALVFLPCAGIVERNRATLYCGMSLVRHPINGEWIVGRCSECDTQDSGEHPT